MENLNIPLVHHSAYSRTAGEKMYESGLMLAASITGEAWLALLRQVIDYGTPVGPELRECRHVQVHIKNINNDDPILERHAHPGHIEEMKAVFFSERPNIFGHNYYRFLRGPKGLHDLSDVIEYLQCDPTTKQAVVVLVGDEHKTPCLQAVHFVIRNGYLETSYFARGQDIFSKYYADVLAIGEMSRLVAEQIKLPCGCQVGFISSAHVYEHDIEAAKLLLLQYKV